MQASLRFSESVIKKMMSAIIDVEGNEVFFTGIIDENGIVISVDIAARGNEEAVPIQYEMAKESHVLIHNHPSGKLYPSQADLSIAAKVAELSQGFYIINNTVDDVYVVVEPIKPFVKQKLDSSIAVSYLRTGGALEAVSDYFEERPSQIELLKNICEIFNSDGIGVFEAGTGVGKSYAYLIPAILWTLNNKERIVISTGTINLQQQLAEKDIPAAMKLMEKPVKYLLLKGRQNYVCLRRLYQQISEPDLFTDENDELNKLIEWAKTSETGNKSDLSFMPTESVWRSICSESDGCMGMRCQYREKCFIMKLRKEAADAQILIVNHHLLFSDIEMRLASSGFDDTAVLPPYKRIIFDEAHGIEAAATSFFSEVVNKFIISKQLQMLFRTRRNGAVAGHLFTLSSLSSLEDTSSFVIASIENIKIQMQLLEDSAIALLDNQYTLRLSNTTSYMFDSILTKIELLGNAIVDCTGLFWKIIESIDEDERDIPAVWETKTILRRLDTIAIFCKQYVDWEEHSDSVFFIEKIRLPVFISKTNESNFYCRFVRAPLDIAPKMNQGIFEPMTSVTCVSATLKIANTFNYWLNRSGANFAEPERVKTGDFISPFPYETNMLFAVTSDAPFPNSNEFQSYTEHAITQLILSASGRSLVLFTSYESLRAACNIARAELNGTGITVLKQGDDDRFKLLEHFKNDNKSVLFATDSFWEGVDVPGDSLSQVIIVKLPFSVPNDPIFAARSEALEKKGRSGFMELSVPEAIIKFRQGIGRLMRRSSDYGCVVVLDRRIVEKNYGKFFMNSIPSCKRIYEPLETVCTSVERFLTEVQSL